jgi:glycosyltransferase involved in cell wall biosynthesis
MKIAIDARWIFPEISGIGAYTRELIRHLAALDRKNEYLLFFRDARIRDRTFDETGLSSSPNFNSRIIDCGVFSIWSQLLVPTVLKQRWVDVYHSTNYMIPLRAFPRNGSGRTKCVVTIHDVIPMILPSHAPKSKKARLYPIYRWLMRQVGARAGAIITVSNASRKDVIKHLQIPAESEAKVKAVYNGVADRFTAPATRKRRDGNEPRVILYVGRSDPYKNIAALICALSIARKKASFPINLLIAGSPDPRYPEAARLAAEMGVQDAITWTGYVSDEELVVAYQGADVLVHPSRYEGFGLQVAEAMSCGLPVICSNAGGLPEVAGDAAILLDPDNVSGFGQKIVDVLSNESLADEMSKKGLSQAAKFTWQRTAAETLAIYEEISRDAIS